MKCGTLVAPATKIIYVFVGFLSAAHGQPLAVVLHTSVTIVIRYCNLMDVAKPDSFSIMFFILLFIQGHYLILPIALP